MHFGGIFFKKSNRGITMKLNPLDTIHGTIVAGIVLAVVLTFVVKWLASA